MQARQDGVSVHVGQLHVDQRELRAQAQGGKARMLAVSGLRRWPDLPDLPTMDESGFKGFNNIFWMGFYFG